MNRRGFTLAEVLVVTALFAIMVVFGVGILLSNNRFYFQQSGEIRAIAATRETSARLAEFGRTADSVVSSHTYDFVNYETDADTVVFRMPSLTGSGDIIDGLYDYGIVTRDPGNSSRLILVSDAEDASARLDRILEISLAVTQLSFVYDNPDPTLAGRVDFEITVTEPGRNPSSEHVVGSVTLRNKP